MNSSQTGSVATDEAVAANSAPAPSSEAESQTTMRQDELGEDFTPWRRIQVWLATRAVWILIWLVNWSARYRVEGFEHYQTCKTRGEPVILSFWHNQIFSATYFWRFRDIVVMASRHLDGQIIARIIGLFGYGTAMGSSSRGAVRALLEMKNRLLEGLDVAFTVDGPRGPVYEVKPGPLWLSRKTGLPIVCFHVQPRRYWQLKSWDAFQIPKPFTRILVKISPPLFVSSEEEEKVSIAKYQAEMDRLRQECEEWKGS